MGLFDRRRDDDDPSLVAAKADAEGALPAGWTLAEEDREGFHLMGKSGIALDVWATAAEGPNGELELAVGCDRAGAYTALALRLRGDLDQTEAWSPPLHHVKRH